MNIARRFWLILTPRQRWWCVAAQLASIVMALSTVAGVAAISPFFAVLGDPSSIGRNPLLQRLFLELGLHDRHSFVVALGLGFLAVVVLSNLLNLAGSYALLRLALWIGDDLRNVLLGEYLRRGYLFHVTNHRAALHNNIVHETTRLVRGMLQNLFLLGTSLATALLILASVLLISPVSAVAVIAGLGGGYCLVYAAVQRRILDSGRIESELLARRTQLLMEALGAIKDIIVQRRQRFFQDRFESMSRTLSSVEAYIDTATHSPRHIMECLAVGGLVGAALLMSDAEGGIGPSLARLTFLGFAVYRLLPAFQQAFAAMIQIRASLPAFQAVSTELIAARSARPAAAVREAPFAGRPRREIRFNGVSVRYPGQSSPALRDISLRIAAGSIVGVAGANGSGKTTLVDVLAGLLAPESGGVEIDGLPVDEARRAAWQTRIAYVPQDLFLLDASIAENIALGVAPSDIDRARLERAARLAGLAELICAPRGGFELRIGEGGVRVSGGQRQRIGIARALYTDAAVLIFDEATSALDNLAEEELMACVNSLRGARTIVLIAHRLNTLRQCDSVFELESGALVRSGTWAELTLRSQRFARAAATDDLHGRSVP